MTVERGKIREFARGHDVDNPEYLDDPVPPIEPRSSPRSASGRRRAVGVLEGEDGPAARAARRAGVHVPRSAAARRRGAHGPDPRRRDLREGRQARRHDDVRRHRHRVPRRGRQASSPKRAPPRSRPASPRPRKRDGARRWDDLDVGAGAEPRTVGPLTRTDFVRYQGASGDFNPIHHDEEFAQAAGYPTVFSVGMLQAGILATLATDWLGATTCAGSACSSASRCGRATGSRARASVVERRRGTTASAPWTSSCSCTRVERVARDQGMGDVRRAVVSARCCARRRRPPTGRWSSWSDRVPEPGPGEVRVAVSACGCCRTDLHVVEGDLDLPLLPVTPGHQVVGTVDALGEAARRLASATGSA